MPRAAVLLAVAAVALAAHRASGQNPPISTALDAATRTAVVSEVAATIRERYADRAVGDSLAATLTRNLEAGRYDSIASLDGLAAAVMAVIRSRVADRHFNFVVVQERTGTGQAAPRQPSRNGLGAVRMLQDGVAYVEMDAMPGDSVSQRVVREALAALPEVRAVVLDLRWNVGGSAAMVRLLCSHFLDAGELLYRVRAGSGSQPSEARAEPQPRRFGPEVPVYILTADGTHSAAEAFAYILRDYGRATLVGEATPGMANPSRSYPISGGFRLTVPFQLFLYGRSGTTYAGVGLVPDLAAPPDSALDAALADIRRRAAGAGRQE